MRLERLEYLRGFAAVYVFVTHLVLPLTPDKGIGALPFRFGQEAVMMFFLISGFVIFYSYEAGRDKSLRGYFLRRWKRIYPIFLLALLLAAFAKDPPEGSASLTTLIGNLLMLQDIVEYKPGVWFPTFGGDFPLWSLSYEWWFYVLFIPFHRLLPAGWAKYAVCATSLGGVVAYNLWPNQPFLFLIYFTIWWTGAEAARAYLAGKPIPPIQMVLLGLVAAALAVPVVIALREQRPLGLGVHPVLELRHAVSALMFVIGAELWRRVRWQGFDALFRVFRFAAPSSYAIYVFHVAILNLVAALTLPIFLAMPLAIVLVAGAATLAEGPFQRWVNRALSPRKPAATTPALGLRTPLPPTP